jgi:hypothetical protein
MKRNTTALTTAVLLAMGASGAANASVDEPGMLDIDIAAGSIISQGLSLGETDIAEAKRIITAKKTPGRKTAPPKRKKAS